MPPPSTLTGQTRIAPGRTASMSMWPSVRCSLSSAAVIAKRCGAPTRNEPKSPALCESGIVIDGEVPSWPMNGRGHADDVVRREQQDRVLARVVGQRGDPRGVVGERLGRVAADGDADRVRRV